VSGVTGADLKGRIEGIMTSGVARELDFGRKLLLAVAGFTAIAAPIVVGILNAPPIRAQSASEPRPAFEVASVKVNKSGSRGGLEFGANGRLSARNMPLIFLISTAYNVPFQGPRLKGLTAEAAGESYDIEASAESGAIPPGASRLVREAKMKLMLQTLLEDRFKLKMRREIKEMPIYAVIVGKNGPKLTKSKIAEEDCPISITDNGVGCHNFRGGMGRGLHADAISMADLVLAVSNWADRPVVDRTGLEGLFQIDTDGWAPMLPRAAGGNEDETKALNDPERPTLYLIFERLGLKMESSKAPVEMFVVEHVEKPTEN
jgi:uncharacterized protein (TIGR03435 family)